MNELKATAGPWHQELTDIGDCNQPSTRRVFGSDNSYEATICELWSGVGNQKANADLIAAAPELYSALATLMLYFTSGNSVPVEKATIQTESEDIKRGFAALQKARGE